MSKVALSFLACAALITAQDYTISTFAGGPPASQPAPGTNIAIGSPGGVALDRDGNLYISGGLNLAFRLDKEACSGASRVESWASAATAVLRSQLPSAWTLVRQDGCPEWL